MASQRGESLDTVMARRKSIDKSHYFYIAVIGAVILGALVGLA
jgi:aerobic C4-dicarboxylate transport protein